MWRVAQREAKTLFLILFDVDHFKQFNDIYGHQAGDDCLRRVASLALVCVHRPQDMVFRYGGEEFVVALPETDGLAAMAIAERLRSLFAAVKTPAPSGETIHCTVSIGISVCNPDDDETSLIRRADEACYRAKQAGKRGMQLSAVNTSGRAA